VPDAAIRLDLRVLGALRKEIAIVVVCVGCSARIPRDQSDGGTSDAANVATDDAGNISITGDTADAPGCPPGTYPPGTYTPYSAPGKSPRGAVAALPWHGPDGGYPNGVENFTAYSAGEMVECSSAKDRTYLDVTDGCLRAIATTGGSGMRGEVMATSEGYFRTVAKGYGDGDAVHPVRWTDQSVSYRFRYTEQTGDVGNPGFKAFARYNTELDLYVASWRTDGVVQIQKKLCGDYTPLVVDYNYPIPSTSTWHTLKFDAVGPTLTLYLDGALAVTATDSTFKSGTAGMRIDSMNYAAIADWQVSAP
jgi:hypothetical protein